MNGINIVHHFISNQNWMDMNIQAAADGEMIQIVDWHGYILSLHHNNHNPQH